MKRRKRWRMEAVLLVLCVCLTACVGRAAPLPDPCAGGFRAELIWERNGILLRAEVTAAEPTEQGAREVTLAFSAPEAMVGLCVTRDGSGIRAELDGITWTEVDGEGYFLAVDLLLATDGLTYVCDTERNGETVRVAEGTYKGGLCQRYCAVPKGEPRFLVWGETEVTVVGFRNEE